MNQLELPAIRPSHAPGSIMDRFIEFHRLNPNIYDMIVKRAFMLKRVGHKFYGIKSIIENIRWHYDTRTVGNAYKINNNFPAHYSRMIQENIPALRGFFRVRATRS